MAREEGALALAPRRAHVVDERLELHQRLVPPPLLAALEPRLEAQRVARGRPAPRRRERRAHVGLHLLDALRRRSARLDDGALGEEKALLERREAAVGAVATAAILARAPVRAAATGGIVGARVAVHELGRIEQLLILLHHARGDAALRRLIARTETRAVGRLRVRRRVRGAADAAHQERRGVLLMLGPPAERAAEIDLQAKRALRARQLDRRGRTPPMVQEHRRVLEVAQRAKIAPTFTERIPADRP